MIRRESDKCSRLYLIDLTDSYAIDERLIGKHIDIQVSDTITLSIVIPSLIRKGKRVELYVPDISAKYEIENDCWGKVKVYQTIDKPDFYDAWISNVAVECFGESLSTLPSTQAIQEIAKKLVHALQIINPDAIRNPSDSQHDMLCEVSAAVDVEDGRILQTEIRLSSNLDTRRSRLSFDDIKKGIRNVEKTISVPYEMLDNARINLSRLDSRAAVLNCATAIEIMLKRKIVDYLDGSAESEVIKEYILRQADRYTKLVELCKTFSISLACMPDVKEIIMNVRNRIIHGGYVPTRQEANEAYNSTRLSLKVLNVPMFE